MSGIRTTRALLLLLLLVLPLRANQQNTADQTTVAAINQPAAGSVKTAPQDKPPERPPLWDIYWPNLALAVVGIGAAIIALFTLKAIQRQAKLTEDALTASRQSNEAVRITAETTRRSFEATMKTERARIAGEMEPLPVPYVPNAVVRMACHLRNLGRTPAWILTKGEEKAILDKTETLPINYPIFKQVTRWPGKGALLPPNGSLIAILYLFIGEPLSIYDGDKTLWVYGFVEYRDIFGRLHVYRYCFRYFPQLGGADPVTCGFYLDGPPEYNREVDVEEEPNPG